ncbi:uncharacterized protein LAESUDRAFT_163768 [Laetiporus sulphureus 93-53]|uniref:Uncharacterized protein n=1 Tax=Laetiporus sulphureus 93-53 TaxID=1314785 RepID=A0A165HQ15_9APHY|nr:uncharacterized protein LAESUDRAFT_163768 [Laetiporus sulphureus 93-53]KZT12032.1 hypothetical protein LAESUDRAFT_163768 [Laetiporus sulphureus 93-53]
MRLSFSDFGRLLLNAPALFHLSLLSAGPGGCIEEWTSSVVKVERENTPDSPTDQITLPLIVPSIRYLEFSIRNDCYIEEFTQRNWPSALSYQT